jgi:hypothetical protein
VRGERVLAAGALDGPAAHLVRDHEPMLTRGTIDTERHDDTYSAEVMDEHLSWRVPSTKGREKSSSRQFREK